MQLHQTPTQERKVGDTDVDVGVEMAVGPLVASGCSLSELKEHCCGSENLTTPTGGRTMKH